MRTLAIILLAAACGGAAPSPDGPKASEEPVIKAMLARLSTEAGCPGSKRVWCIAADGWAAGTAPELPTDAVFVGVSVGLEQEQPPGKLLETEVALAALAVHEGKGLVTDVPAENPAEKKLIDEAVASAGKVLKGEAERVSVAPSLGRYLSSLPATARYELARAGSEWRMRGKSNARLRKVGRAWVVIEVPTEGPEGIFLSIFVE